MKKLIFSALLLSLTFCALYAQQSGRPLRETGKEAGMMLDLQKVSLGTVSSVEQKKQYLSTVQLEKQRIQNFTLRMVYENAYTLYRRGDYQRAMELANVILSIDPSMTKAQTLATEAGRMATYGTISEQEIINMKYEEARSLYKSGRLVSAQAKYEEILVLRPYEAEAKDWVRRIDDEIAQQHIRRGFYAYKAGDYNEAINQWYSVLLIKKDDQDLINKIAEVEDKMKREESKRLIAGAMNLYDQGKLITSYREFEKALAVQPGEQQAQKYAMQLKTEIASGYLASGNKAYNNKKFDTAIANWRAAKEWGYNQNDINALIKSAERAKAQAAAAPKKQPVKVVGPATGTTETGGTELPEIPGLPGVELPGAITIPTGEIPTKILVNQPGTVTEESREASIQRYKTGIFYYNQGNYERAKEEWQAALRLNPENGDAALGLKRIEAQYAGR